MYVVRRSFRHLNKMLAPGSVVEPGSIKNFKSRLRDRFLVEVSEQDFDKWNAYFKVKYGTPILVPNDKKPEDKKPEGVKPAGEKPSAKPAVVVAAKTK